MSEGRRAKEIDLGEDFGEVIINVTCARIAVSADGHIRVIASSGVGADGVNVRSRIKEIPVINTPAGGERPDGTIHMGISPDTGKQMYTTPTDAPLAYTFNAAVKYVDELNRKEYLGHRDWRIPTKNELNVLFNNRAVIGYGEDGLDRDRWYWSSAEDGYNAWVQSFNKGWQMLNTQFHELYLRPVCG